MRRKLPSESQVTFAAALRSLAARAFRGQAGPLLERMLVQQFMEGQLSAEVRHQLLSNRPQDVDTAVQRAVEIESAYHIEALRSSSSLTLPNTTAAISHSSASASPAPAQSSPAGDSEFLRLLKSIDAKLDRLSLVAPDPKHTTDTFGLFCHSRSEVVVEVVHLVHALIVVKLAIFASSCPQFARPGTSSTASNSGNQ